MKKRAYKTGEKGCYKAVIKDPKIRDKA